MLRTPNDRFIRICYDPVTLTVMAVAAGLGTAYQGYAANQTAKAQASAIEEQGRIAKAEADTAATQRDTERRKFLAEQRMAYLASGVSLSGTPGIVGEETSKEFQMEIDAIRRSGAAQYGLAMQNAATTRNSGRAALISGVLQGIGTAASGVSKSGITSAGTTKATTSIYSTGTAPSNTSIYKTPTFK